MTSVYRLIVTCDETRGPGCLGLIEYASPDRLDLARQSDRHAQSGWLRGYRAKDTYDVCPQCRTLVEAEMHPELRKEIQTDG